MFRVVSDIDAIAVVVAVVANMVVGMVWYSPNVFGNTWMKLVGLTPQKIKERGGPAKAMTVAVVASVVTALTIAFLFVLADVRTVQEGIIVSLFLSIGVVTMNQITHGIFEGRAATLTALSAAHDIVSYLVMGIILALWR